MKSRALDAEFGDAVVERDCDLAVLDVDREVGHDDVGCLRGVVTESGARLGVER